MKPSFGCGDNCDYCTAGKYDFYDKEDGTPLSSPVEYGKAGGVGRGGQCKYFAHLILHRAIGMEEIESYDDMAKSQSIPAIKKDKITGITSVQAQPGDIIFRTDYDHTAVVVEVDYSKKSVMVIESNMTFNGYYPDDVAWSCKSGSGESNEIIGTRTLSESVLKSESYKIWTGKEDGAYRDYYNSYYYASKPIVFIIDDTGSMSTNIIYAKNAAIRIMNEEKARIESEYCKTHCDASCSERLYTLITFKDGTEEIDRQTYDIDHMIDSLNGLYASGGAGCPESSLTAIRNACKLVRNADIYLMTDASSNSYGVDETYADMKEVNETKNAVLTSRGTLHSIIYSDCGPAPMSSLLSKSASAAYDDMQSQCNKVASSAIIAKAALFDPAGLDGYSLLSFASGGLFFNIPSNQTETATEMIMKQSFSESTIAFYDGDGAKSYSIPVDGSVSVLQLALNVTLGSSVLVELKNPSGATVTDATDGVSVLTSGGNVFYSVEEDALVDGNWTASVTGSGTYRISATALTSNPMTYSGDTSVPVGSSLNLSAGLIFPVPGVSFELVNLDGTLALDTSLTTVDGLNYSGTSLMDTIGSFRFKATGEGNFQRMNPATITIGSLDVIVPEGMNLLKGTSASYPCEVRNLGTVEDTYDFFVTSSLGWAATASIPPQITLPAGGVFKINLPVTVPVDAEAGDADTLSVQAISQANSLIYDIDELQTVVKLQSSASIPTMTEWGMIIFMLLVGSVSFYFIKKQQR
ncbi:MAG: hypothetical protein C4518_09715 [Desulfobacteraceae bacterium]|nr:MAG: hypothetical protein C4518_09715 [Desulfobacteraceae bacterium]